MEKAVGPDGVPVELFKIALNGDPALRKRLFDIVVGIWRGGDVPQQWKDPIIKVLHKKKNRIECGNYRGFPLRRVAVGDFGHPSIPRWHVGMRACVRLDDGVCSG